MWNRTFTLLLLLMGCSFTIAQEHFYYGREGKKIPLEISTDKISVQFNEMTTEKEAAQFLKNYTLFDTIKSLTAVPGWFVASLKHTDASGIKFLTQTLKIRNEIYDAQPVYLTENVEAVVYDKFIVRFKPEVTLDQIKEFSKKNNITIIDNETAIPNYYVFRLNSKSSLSVLEMSQLYFESMPAIYSMPDFIMPVTLFSDPTDLYYPYQYYLNQSNNIDVNAPEAWNITKGNYNITVAVIDEGVAAHEDLPSGRFDVGWDAFGQTNGSPQGNQAHGMACAGIIAASHNGVGIAGIAPNCKISAIRIYDRYGTSASNNQIATSFTFAWTSGHAAVISCSWGFGTYSAICDNDFVPSIRDAIELAMTNGRAGKGSVVVFAAGNFNRTSCATFPSNVPGVVTVGAITRNGEIQSYSPHDAKMDLVAPSGLTGSEKYNNEICWWGIKQITMRGDLWSMDISGQPGYNPGNYQICSEPYDRYYVWTMPGGYPIPGINYTAHFGGTSATAPQVAGAAALMLSVAPEMPQSLVHSFLRYTATRYGSPNPDYGWGRLNIFGAVQLASTVAKLSFQNINNETDYDLDAIQKLQKENTNLTVASFPNPFNPLATIQYRLPEASRVELKVYNMLGQQVELLINAFQIGGLYEVQFNGTKLPSGNYFYRLEALGEVKTGKIILLK